MGALDAKSLAREIAGMRFSPRRSLGRTGFRATALGVGDLADRELPIDVCVDTLRRALDAGLNVVDTAPAYEDGYSETIVGRALRGRRDGVFLIDKIDHVDRPVRPQVEQSLRTLGLEHVDAFVFHGVSSDEAWARVVSERLGELDDCVRAGLCRFRGLSTHHPRVARAALDADVCDVLLFPIGPFTDARYESEVLPLARARNVGTISFKTFGAGKLLGDTAGYGRPLAGRSSSGPPTLPTLTVDECVSYTLTADPDVALLGLSSPAEQDSAFAAAERFVPLDAGALAELRRRAALAIEGKGPVWWNPAG